MMQRKVLYRRYGFKSRIQETLNALEPAKRRRRIKEETKQEDEDTTDDCVV